MVVLPRWKAETQSLRRQQLVALWGARGRSAQSELPAFALLRGLPAPLASDPLRLMWHWLWR